MALERVLGVFGVVVRFDESDPHGPSTIGADRTLRGLRRIENVSHPALQLPRPFAGGSVTGL
jgi:hypothetical protein